MWGGGRERIWDHAPRLQDKEETHVWPMSHSIMTTQANKIRTNTCAGEAFGRIHTGESKRESIICTMIGAHPRRGQSVEMWLLFTTTFSACQSMTTETQVPMTKNRWVPRTIISPGCAKTLRHAEEASSMHERAEQYCIRNWSDANACQLWPVKLGQAGVVQLTMSRIGIDAFLFFGSNKAGGNGWVAATCGSMDVGSISLYLNKSVRIFSSRGSLQRDVGHKCRLALSRSLWSVAF